MRASEKTPLTRRESENRVLGPSGKPLLVIVEGKDIDAMVDAGIEAIGGLGRIIGNYRKVILKPNTNQRDPFPSITAPETMRAVSRHCRLAGAEHIVVHEDRKFEGDETLVKRAEAESNGVDVLVNNAGLDVIYPYEKLEPEIIDQIIEVNLTAPMILSRLFLPKMIERGRGHIVNISSLSGLVGTPYDEAYTASKHGLVGFTRSLRLTAIGEAYPVGVSVVCPGFISEVGMYNTASKGSGLEAPAIFGTSPPENVAKAVVSAIIKDKAEVIVNPKPFRPLLFVQALAPSLAPWFTLKTGALELFKGFAQHKMKEMTPER